MLEAIPAHYLHSCGNFNLWDPKAKILFTGDIGAALLPPGEMHELFVEDFEQHIPYIKVFHQRWMASNLAKNEWCARVRELAPEMLCPQHGSIYRGKAVMQFIDWFEALEVGVLGVQAPELDVG
jgi:flavorubredoxin